MRSSPGAVKRFAAQMSFPVFQPSTLRTPEVEATVRAVGADAMVVAAYGLILPPTLLHAALHGALNIHASLLPRWRGAAPIQRALLAGDHETGITIMRMEEGLDTGPILAQRRIAIALGEDAGSLHV
jgi:methionyl-tRNA formyltransferase